MRNRPIVRRWGIRIGNHWGGFFFFFSKKNRKQHRRVWGYAEKGITVTLYFSVSFRLLIRFYKRISSLSKQKPTERGRRRRLHTAPSPSIPQSLDLPSCRQSLGHAQPQGTPTPWPFRGRSSSTTPTVTACSFIPPFLAKFRSVFLRLVGFNRIGWFRRGFVLVYFCRCSDGVHRGAGGNLPGPAVPGRVPSGDISH